MTCAHTRTILKTQTTPDAKITSTKSPLSYLREVIEEGGKAEHTLIDILEKAIEQSKPLLTQATSQGLEEVPIFKSWKGSTYKLYIQKEAIAQASRGELGFEIDTAKNSQLILKKDGILLHFYRMTDTSYNIGPTIWNNSMMPKIAAQNLAILKPDQRTNTSQQELFSSEHDGRMRVVVCYAVDDEDSLSDVALSFPIRVDTHDRASEYFFVCSIYSSPSSSLSYSREDLLPGFEEASELFEVPDSFFQFQIGRDRAKDVEGKDEK